MARGKLKKDLYTWEEGQALVVCPSSSIGKIETTSYIKPYTEAQRSFVKAMKSSDLTIGYGSAGTGKSLLALHTGVSLINNENSGIERLIYVRANVDMDDEDGLGYLPGGYIDKIRPLAYPVIDNLITFMAKGTVDFLINEGRIEVMTMSMMRGRSFSNSFIIVDEAQNASPKSMKTMLTRLGSSSKMIIIGDPTQVDRVRGEGDGLSDLIDRVTPLVSDPPEGFDVSLVRFTPEDIVRHSLLRHIIAIYGDV